jgi:hypothetical protein
MSARASRARAIIEGRARMAPGFAVATAPPVAGAHSTFDLA